MFDFHEKRKIRSILYSKPIIIGLFVVAGFLSTAVYNRYVVAVEIKDKLDARRAELVELESRAQVLESKVQYLEDKRGVEEELRNRFDVVKEGEQMVVLLDERKSETATVSPIETPQETKKSESSFFDILKFW